MRVRVLYFAVLREVMRRSEEVVEVEPGTSAGELLDLLESRASKPDRIWTRLAMAVNREYAARDAVLREGDEIALLPPVSGGGR